MKNFGKDKIYKNLALELKITDVLSKSFFEFVFEQIKKTIINGEDVLIIGFGQWNVKHKKSRKVQNISKKETIVLPERKVVTFKMSNVFKRELNKENQVYKKIA